MPELLPAEQGEEVDRSPNRKAPGAILRVSFVYPSESMIEGEDHGDASERLTGGRHRRVIRPRGEMVRIVFRHNPRKAVADNRTAT